MEGGYFEQKRLSPTGMAVVVLLHGVALFALMTAKGEIIDVIRDPPLITIPLRDPPPPPPEPLPKPNPSPQHRSVIDTVEPVVDLPAPPVTIDIAKLDPPKTFFDPPGQATVSPPPPPIPVHEPVRVEPRIDSNSALQPPYPASAQREGVEGTVQVRVAIGADGRVKAVEKVGGGRDDFFAATQRQALRYWRFKPATLDGKPIESSKVMTVHFRLDDLG